MTQSTIFRATLVRGISAAAFAAALVFGAPATAQTITSTIRGNVTLDNHAASSATVTATNTDTGSVVTVKTLGDGSYVLTGLLPGNYDIKVESGDADTVRRVSVQVAQTADLNVQLFAGKVNEIVVVGRLYETKTSEIATNVTRDQIDNLPQGNRNFLNFAGLAPGISLSNDPQRQVFSGGGVGVTADDFGGPKVNVFIDGVSLKSNIQQGGIVGQDSSRGNPFSQLAVQEFRTITQQFKAEYEDAGTAIITAVTKSGTNEFHGEAFGLFRPTSFTSRDPIQVQQGLDKPKQDQYQFGVSLGGPIIKDKLHFFLAYEGNFREAANTVVPGTPAPGSNFTLDLNQYAGTLNAPFREHNGFGKLDLEVSDNHKVELTGSIRTERETRDFGGTAAITRATNVQNDVYSASLKDILSGEGWTNEASFNFLQYNLQFQAVNQNEFGQIYNGVIEIGGRADSQNILQRSYTLRDNFTYTGLEGHALKAGVRIAFEHYGVSGSGPARNPQFSYRYDPRVVNGEVVGNGLDYSIPERVDFGSGDPTINADTTQFGFYVQDDWKPTEKLTINAGVRWDFETNANNNSFVLPAAQAATLRALDADPRTLDSFHAEDYISDGKNRKIDFGQIAPRLGLSYDIWGDQRTVLFGGWGRYFDRTIFRAAAEEAQRVQFALSQVYFTPADGGPRLDGRPTVQFNPSYLTPAGFEVFRNTPGVADGEIRVNPNNLKAPRTDQWSIGVRQKFDLLHSAFNSSFSYVNQKTRNLIGYYPANRSEAFNADGSRDFIPLTGNFSNVVAASNARANNFQALYLSVDKPYSKASGWGIGIAYTYVIKSEERGYQFNFDHPLISAQPFLPNAGNEKHHLVVNTINDLPFGFIFSSLWNYSSGQPFQVIDATNGFSDQNIVLSNVGKSYDFFTADIRLAKNVKLFGKHKVGVSFEVFNLFDTNNFTGYNGFFGPGDTVGPIVANSAAPGRSFQLGVNYKF
ncbi:MAG: TonB-dependent receptor [Sphingomonas sp.]|jgi:outer membrane receptor protein involved in Fe transport